MSEVKDFFVGEHQSLILPGNGAIWHFWALNVVLSVLRHDRKSRLSSALMCGETGFG